MSCCALQHPRISPCIVVVSEHELRGPLVRVLEAGIRVNEVPSRGALCCPYRCPHHPCHTRRWRAWPSSRDVFAVLRSRRRSRMMDQATARHLCLPRRWLLPVGECCTNPMLRSLHCRTADDLHRIQIRLLKGACDVTQGLSGVSLLTRTKRGRSGLLWWGLQGVGGPAAA